MQGFTILGGYHGLWSVLCRMYPNADIPVVCLSVALNLSADVILKLGSSLAKWREYGVLILGSGNIVHNLAFMDWQRQDFGYEWAIEFDETIKNLIVQKDFKKILDFKNIKNSYQCFNTTEHFLPFLYVLGASNEDKPMIFNQSYQYGSISMTSYLELAD